MKRLDISIEQWNEITGSVISSEMADIIYMFTEGQTIRQIAGSDYDEQRRIYHVDRVSRARIRRDLMNEASKIGLNSKSDVGVGICHSCGDVATGLKDDPREAIPMKSRLYGGFKICETCFSDITQAPN